MDDQPAFDRSILIPIFLSGFSVIGIVVVLLIGRSLSAPPEVPMTPSATRFAYVYLGTEPAITTPLIDETEIVITDEPIFEEPTEEQITAPPVLATLTRPGPSTPIILPSATGNLQRTNTPAAPTASSVSSAPLTPATYDDVDSNLVYSPPNAWAANNAGGTLHVSTVPGSTISFRFVGTQLRLRYQGGLSLGQMRITVDNVSETLDQSDGNTEWLWPNSLTNVTHTVLITHVGGGAVNLDQVIILAPATPTPSVTPTRTPGT
ncbi:MAG TPA: hypothetical protein VFY66_13370 [Anaerolineales bacterium]|nr:hypothetical protein [Anaerolineales bacterium]